MLRGAERFQSVTYYEAEITAATMEKVLKRKKAKKSKTDVDKAEL
jgi:hypothetical protein